MDLAPLIPTATAGPALDELVTQGAGVVAAFRDGVLPGLAATFALLLGVLNFGPLKRILQRSRVDWLRPALTLVGMAGGGVVGALIGGAGAWDAVAAAVGVLVSGGGPVATQLVRDWLD